jgi:hypothetical protein
LVVVEVPVADLLVVLVVQVVVVLIPALPVDLELPDKVTMAEVVLRRALVVVAVEVQPVLLLHSLPAVPAV